MKLYMVSLGPGDFELVTIKALKALKKSSVVCVPTKSPDQSFKKSLTYKIVKSLMSEFEFEREIIPLYAPMHFKTQDWQRQVDILMQNLKDHQSVSFVTLGDSSIYSSVYYLLDLIKQQHKEVHEKSEVIPGVTSFSQASAKSKKPLCLGDSSLQIIPLLDKDVPSTTIYMRPKIGLDTKDIPQNGDMYTFENLNFKEEKIYPHKKRVVDKYMTLFIDFV